jgi:hypothetical protein
MVVVLDAGPSETVPAGTPFGVVRGAVTGGACATGAARLMAASKEDVTIVRMTMFATARSDLKSENELKRRNVILKDLWPACTLALYNFRYVVQTLIWQCRSAAHRYAGYSTVISSRQLVLGRNPCTSK